MIGGECEDGGTTPGTKKNNEVPITTKSNALGQSIDSINTQNSKDSENSEDSDNSDNTGDSDNTSNSDNSDSSDISDTNDSSERNDGSFNGDDSSENTDVNDNTHSGHSNDNTSDTHDNNTGNGTDNGDLDANEATESPQSEASKTSRNFETANTNSGAENMGDAGWQDVTAPTISTAIETASQSAPNKYGKRTGHSEHQIQSEGTHLASGNSVSAISILLSGVVLTVIAAIAVGLVVRSRSRRQRLPVAATCSNDERGNVTGELELAVL